MKLTEEIVNVVGSGAIAGAGVGPQGEPGVSKKHNPKIGTVKRKTFKEFMNVPSNRT